ncbi:MAG: tRNA preQ1(34) S-adenosylmethionine ribosyltransferase-isomerase QueA [Acidimicrobiia bacterium]|nr:MAG: tRNA preQ1(34) S-adenosylmethionine ribosyltransferase-isomerase QueA [Acidimicrobiia bacterium]
MLIDNFDYALPADAIAQSAIEPRHDARVLIASDLSELVFREIASLFEPGDLLVVNRTRVRAARLIGHRVPSGGAVELLVTKRIDPHRWQALVRPAKRLRSGSIIRCEGIQAALITDPVGGVATVTLTADGDIEDAIEQTGEVPLPPYFHGSLSSPERYQTLFATVLGSSAAPTAALHFTEQVVSSLRANDVEISEVELEVGLDTFRPMEDGPVEDHRIHSERVVVDAEAVSAIERARAAGGKIIAVGTTVVRALESAAQGNGHIGKYSGETDLFITPGYRFTVVDALLTNFHAPRTTLIVMIAAIVGDGWREVYRHAVESGFRFLSFGDAMYIEVPR